MVVVGAVVFVLVVGDCVVVSVLVLVMFLGYGVVVGGRGPVVVVFASVVFAVCDVGVV